MMARPATGTIVEKSTSSGTSYAIRFRAYGDRQYELLGYASEGWNRRRAEDALANTLADVRRGQWLPPDRRRPEAPPEIPTFHAFASEWLAARKLDGLRPRSIEHLEWALTHHLLPTFAPLRLDEITVEEVDRYARAQAQAGRLNNRSINHTLDVLSSVLEVAVEYEHIRRNVAKGKRRRLAATKPRRSYLDCAEHITALIDGAAAVDRASLTRAGQRRALIATLVFAGLRIGEALDLRWSDVNLADGKLRVRVASKTEAGFRVIDIKPVLRDELVTYRAGLQDLSRDALVFGSTKGTRLSESNVRQRILAKAVEHADKALAKHDLEQLPERLTPHSLRRTFASMLAALNEPMPSTMRQMGHTDPAFTLRVYAHDAARGEGERARLRALVEAVEWAPMGTSGVREGLAAAA
jgi:integrase